MEAIDLNKLRYAKALINLGEKHKVKGLKHLMQLANKKSTLKMSKNELETVIDCLINGYNSLSHKLTTSHTPKREYLSCFHAVLWNTLELLEDALAKKTESLELDLWEMDCVIGLTFRELTREKNMPFTIRQGRNYDHLEIAFHRIYNVYQERRREIVMF